MVVAPVARWLPPPEQAAHTTTSTVPTTPSARRPMTIGSASERCPAARDRDRASGQRMTPRDKARAGTTPRARTRLHRVRTRSCASSDRFGVRPLSSGHDEGASYASPLRSSHTAGSERQRLVNLQQFRDWSSAISCKPSPDLSDARDGRAVDIGSTCSPPATITRYDRTIARASSRPCNCIDIPDGYPGQR